MRSACVSLTFVLALLLAACASSEPTPVKSGGEGLDPNAETETKEWAEKKYGEARVFYYVKPGVRGVGGDGKPGAAQKEVRITLINRTHSLYVGLPDNQLKNEEYYLTNADMHDLLVILRDKVGFFSTKNGVVDIRSADPIKRADGEARTERMIGVEIIKDGVVHCTYFSRAPLGDGSLVPGSEAERRFNVFGQAQEWVLRFSRYALPRGSSAPGEGPKIGGRR